jgi:hypothetical protein
MKCVAVHGVARHNLEAFVSCHVGSSVSRIGSDSRSRQLQDQTNKGEL